MACESIGAYKGEPSNFVQFVVDVDPDGACQAVRVGQHSPSAVAAHEALVRFVFAPTHMRNSGEVDESLFADAFKCGASVNRVLAERPDVAHGLHELGEERAAAIRAGSQFRAAQPDRQYLGQVRMLVSDVRALRVDASQARIRVYDTSQPDNVLHADIVANASGLEKALKKQLRAELFLLAQRSGLYQSPILNGAVDITKTGMVVHST